MAYITIDRLKLLTTMPSAFVDELDPAYVNAQLDYWSSYLDAQLAKRYATPFTDPVPRAVEMWLARIVTPRLWSKRGVNPSDEQWTEVKEDDVNARAEIEKVANGETGLFDLPLNADSLRSGIVRGFPTVYSEASPYVWRERQYQVGSSEDKGGSGTGGTNT